MSKPFMRGGGRRVDEGGVNSGTYKPRRPAPAGGGEEKQRQSVFDRLGTRRVNVNPSPRYSAGPGDGPNTKPKKNIINSRPPERSVSGKQDSGRGSRGPTRTRSRSPAPKYRAKPISTSAGDGHRKVNLKSVVATSKKDKNLHKPISSGNMVQHGTKIKSRSYREESSGKRKVKTAATKGKKVVSGNAKHDKGRKQGHNQSSGTSDSSSHDEESSSTTSSKSSTSSVSDGSSSSDSDASSSTDSSVPSIKLKPEKKGKDPKKKLKKKAVESTKEKEIKSKMEGQAREKKVLPSDESSAASAQVKPHSKELEKRRSSPPAQIMRGGTRETERDFEKKRVTNVVKGGTGRIERDTDRSSRARESGSGLHADRHPPPPRNDRFDEPNRKRRMSGDNYDSPNKRSRVATPPGRPKNVGRRTPSPAPMRAQDSKRDRTPLATSARDRPRAGSPSTKRSTFESHRSEPRRDTKLHYNSPAPFAKIKENERDRDRDRDHRPFASSFGNSFDSPNFSRDDRQRERLAPSRDAPSRDAPSREGPSRDAPQSQVQRERERFLPSHQEDRRNTGSRDVEPAGRRAPLLPFPSDVKPIYQYQQGGNTSHREPFKRGPPAEHRLPVPPTPNFRKRSPLIVKTKEALMEKYEEIRQNRVDMWVDETVRGGGPPPQKTATAVSSNKLVPVERISPASMEKDKDKISSSIGSGNALEKTKELDEDQLSDFSDDADDILTKEVVVPAAVEIEIKQVKDKGEQERIVKDTDSDSAKVSSSNLNEDVLQSKHESGQVRPSATPSTNLPVPADARSQSQSDDDILETMDFEEISDEELGEGETTVGIHDALGVDWSSLVSRNKTEKLATETEADGSKDSGSSRKKLKDKWSAANIFKQVGLCKKLAGEELFEKVFKKIQDMEERNGITDTTSKEELEYPNLKQKRLERQNILEEIGIGPYSRVLSSRRDLAVRRYLLNMPPKSLVTVGIPHQTQAQRS